jgi:SNF2 family DNA or RNA helicase
MNGPYYEKYIRVEHTKLVNIKVFLNGIRRACNKIDNSTTSPKIKWIIKMINDSDLKTLIYSNWVENGIWVLQDELNKRNIDWTEITGSTTINKRKQAVNDFNNGKIGVLFISAAGSEGLDLKGTRRVIILEPHWNDERIKQVIGRAARYKSHVLLPPNQQNVTVYRLILSKPKGNTDKWPSADDMLL